MLKLMKKDINLDDISKSFKIGYVDQTVKLLTIR